MVDALPSARIQYVPIAQIRPSPENDKLYRPVREDDAETIGMTDSVRDRGVLEPIVSSLDNWILSGHRRYAAARLAGLESVPVRYANVRRSDDPNRFVAMLREYNRQRVKTLDEQIRESIIDANPDEARAELLAHRLESSKVSLDRLSIGDVKKRKRITKAKDHMVKAVLSVLDELAGFGAVTDRMIHYRLLNDPPLRHCSKPGSTYRNDRNSYQDLVDLLTRMRQSGVIPIDCITDETRPYVYWNIHRDLGQFFSREIDQFLKGYYRDLQQSQPNHIEVVVEKNTVAGILRPICSEFCLPMTSGRGFCSWPPRAHMLQRFQKSGKDHLIVLLVTDFDPDGEAIAETFGRSMRDDLGVDSIVPIKVAINLEQAQKYQLPTSLEVKLSGSRAPGFVEKYGQSVWELESLPPATLQDIFRESVKSVLDLDLFNREQEREAIDAAKLSTIRESVHKMLAGLDLDGIGGAE